MLKKLLMRSIFLGTLVLFSVGAFAAITPNDATKPILVKKSIPEFTIIVPSNPTTGYSWILKAYDNNIIVPVSRKYLPPENRKLIGAGGYEKWTFRVKAEGFIVPQTTPITLIYLRPWEVEGAQVTIFKVVTNNDD